MSTQDKTQNPRPGTFSSYSVMIGLETHVELNTQSKLFCSCAQKEAEKPNQNTCEICLGFPGSKPTLNKKAVELATRLGQLLNCTVNPHSTFSRKIYFYPDLVKSFQITQYDKPIASNGFFELENKKIRIRRAHMEEDPGKLEYVGGHIATAQYVLVDYNRSGTPLCEIVTEPDFTSVDEAVEYVKKLFSLLSFVGIIDPHKEGVMRTDGNVSIAGGKRVELKNITGADALEKALKAEIHRQTFLKMQNKPINQETRQYSEETGTTILLRSKETEDDYGYIEEPDLLPLVLDESYISTVRKGTPPLPKELKEKLMKEYSLDERTSGIISSKRGFFEYFVACEKQVHDPSFVGRWLVGDFLKCANWHSLEIDECPPPSTIFEFLVHVKKGDISEREGKELIKKLFDHKDKSIKEHMSENSIDLDAVIHDTLKENQEKLAGMDKEKKIKYLIGIILKKTNFKADPKDLNRKLSGLL